MMEQTDDSFVRTDWCANNAGRQNFAGTVAQAESAVVGDVASQYRFALAHNGFTQELTYALVVGLVFGSPTYDVQVLGVFDFCFAGGNHQDRTGVTARSL